MTDLSVEKKINAYVQSNPELKKLSQEQLLSVMVQTGALTAKEAQKVSAFAKTEKTASNTGITLEKQTPKTISEQVSKTPLTKEQAQDLSIEYLSENLQSAIDIYRNTDNGVVSEGYDAIKNLLNTELSSKNVGEVLDKETDGIGFLIKAKEGKLTKREYYEQNKDRLKEMILNRFEQKDDTGVSYLDKLKGNFSKEEFSKIIDNYITQTTDTISTMQGIKDAQHKLLMQNEDETGAFLAKIADKAKTEPTGEFSVEGQFNKLPSLKPDKHPFDSDELMTFDETYKLERGTSFKKESFENLQQSKGEMSFATGAYNKNQELKNNIKILMEEYSKETKIYSDADGNSYGGNEPPAEKRAADISNLFSRYYASAPDNAKKDLDIIINKQKLDLKVNQNEDGRISIEFGELYKNDTQKNKALNNLMKVASQEQEKKLTQLLGGKSFESYIQKYQTDFTAALGKQNADELSKAMEADQMSVVQTYTGLTSMAGMGVMVVGGILTLTPAAPLGSGMVALGGKVALGGMAAKNVLGFTDELTRDNTSDERMTNLKKDLALDLGGLIIGGAAGRQGMKYASQIMRNGGDKALAVLAEKGTDFTLSVAGDLAMIGALNYDEGLAQTLKNNGIGIVVSTITGIKASKEMFRNDFDTAPQRETIMQTNDGRFVTQTTGSETNNIVNGRFDAASERGGATSSSQPNDRVKSTADADALFFERINERLATVTPEEFDSKTRLIKNNEIKNLAKTLAERGELSSSDAALLEDISFALENITDTKIKDYVNRQFKMCELNQMEPGELATDLIQDTRNVLDAYHTLNGNYTRYKKQNDAAFDETNATPVEYLQFLRSANPQKARRFEKYISDAQNNKLDADIHKYDKNLVSDFITSQKTEALKDLLAFTRDNEMADYMYKEMYIKKQNLPKSIEEKCLNISDKYKTKLFLSAESTDRIKEIGLIENEFKLWAEASEGTAHYPKVLDMNKINSSYIDNTAAYGSRAAGELSQVGATLNLDGSTTDVINHALRHELMHLNDRYALSIRAVKALEPKINEIMPRKIVVKNGKQYNVVDYDNCKYREEFLNAGISPKHIAYAYNSREEFIAVASEGDMSKYSPEFKKVLRELGMPEFASKLPVTNPKIKSNVEIIEDIRHDLPNEKDFKKLAGYVQDELEMENFMTLLNTGKNRNGKLFMPADDIAGIADAAARKKAHNEKLLHLTDIGLMEECINYIKKLSPEQADENLTPEILLTMEGTDKILENYRKNPALLAELLEKDADGNFIYADETRFEAFFEMTNNVFEDGKGNIEKIRQVKKIYDYIDNPDKFNNPETAIKDLGIDKAKYEFMKDIFKDIDKNDYGQTNAFIKIGMTLNSEFQYNYFKKLYNEKYDKQIDKELSGITNIVKTPEQAKIADTLIALYNRNNAIHINNGIKIDEVLKLTELEKGTEALQALIDKGPEEIYKQFQYTVIYDRTIKHLKEFKLLDYADNIEFKGLIDIANNDADVIKERLIDTGILDRAKELGFNNDDIYSITRLNQEDFNTFIEKDILNRYKGRSGRTMTAIVQNYDLLEKHRLLDANINDDTIHYLANKDDDFWAVMDNRKEVYKLNKVDSYRLNDIYIMKQELYDTAVKRKLFDIEGISTNAIENLSHLSDDNFEIVKRRIPLEDANKEYLSDIITMPEEEFQTVKKIKDEISNPYNYVNFDDAGRLQGCSAEDIKLAKILLEQKSQTEAVMNSSYIIKSIKQGKLNYNKIKDFINIKEIAKLFSVEELEAISRMNADELEFVKETCLHPKHLSSIFRFSAIEAEECLNMPEIKKNRLREMLNLENRKEPFAGSEIMSLLSLDTKEYETIEKHFGTHLSGKDLYMLASELSPEQTASLGKYIYAERTKPFKTKDLMSLASLTDNQYESVKDLINSGTQKSKVKLHQNLINDPLDGEIIAEIAKLPKERIDLIKNLVDNEYLIKFNELDIDNVKAISKLTEPQLKKLEQSLSKNKDIIPLSDFIELAQFDNDKVFADFDKVKAEAHTKRNQLKSGVEDLTNDDIDSFFTRNKIKMLKSIELLGANTLTHSFTSKLTGVEEILKSVSHLKETLSPEDYNLLKEHLAYKSIEPQDKIFYMKALSAILDEHNAKDAVNYINIIKSNTPPRDLVLNGKAIWDNPKKRFDDKYNEFCEAFNLDKENKRIKDFFDKRAAVNAKGYKILNGVKESDIAKLLEIEYMKRDNLKQWNEAIDSEVFKKMGVQYSPELSARLNLRDNKYLASLLNANSEFKHGFQDLVDDIRDNPDLSVKEIFDKLPQNQRTREIFERFGLDYDKWAEVDKDSYMRVEISTNAEKAKQAAIENLEADLNDAAFKLLPQEETAKIFNALKEMDITFREGKEVIYDANGYDNGHKIYSRLYYQDKPIEFSKMEKALSTIKKVINESDFWTKTHKDAQLNEARETIYNHIMKLRDAEVANSAILKDNEVANLEVHKTDMNNVAHSLFLGNHASCCTAAGTGCNQFSAPTYIMNKCISAIEVMDGKDFVGNTMCYVAEVDGKLSLILDNIELNTKYQFNDKIRDTIFAYAEQLCKEIGRPDMAIYAGPYRHKLNMQHCKSQTHDFSIKGDTDSDRVYLDFKTSGDKIKENKEYKKITLYTIKE